MNARDFCYWLQGYFEISEALLVAPAVGTAKFVACLRSHLALVAEVDPVHTNAFVAWLTLRIDGIDVLEAKSIAQIRAMLNAQFKHDIDPSYGGDAKKLKAIHDGKPKGKGKPMKLSYGPGERC